MKRIPAATSDLDLIRYLREGNVEALGMLYDRHGSLVYTIALKILGHPSEAEDLTQEIFLTFWQKEKFDPQRAVLSTYLCVLTRSRALNQLNRRRRRQRSLQRLRDNTPPIELVAATPLENVALEEQSATLKTALSRLPDKQRQILEMHYYKGMSHSKIAHTLSMPLGTVKTNARQALIKLKTLLIDAVR